MKGKSSRKNTLISLGLVPLALLAMSGNAHAADSTINITGTVVASPCTIEAVKNVDLSDIDATKLATTGSASTFINFGIALSNCPATTTSATATYSGTASNTDYYANSGTAKNVEVEVASTYSSLPMGNGATQNVTIDASTHAASFNLKARVRNNGKGSAATPGTVSSAVQVAVAYK